MQLNFGPSIYCEHAHPDHVEPDMTMEIPQRGDLEPLPEYARKEFQQYEKAIPQITTLEPRVSQQRFIAVEFDRSLD
jgi:hypothetical protein